MSPLPRVGLTTYRERAAWGVWDEPADLLPRSYADSVAAAGAVALLLPPALPDLASAAEAVLDGVHGLVIAGGADVDPTRYGTARSPQTGPSRPDRDAWELELLRVALQRGMPLLAICRGLQLLNVALGGTLVQHLPDVVGTELHCPTPGVLGRHEVRLAAQSRIGAVFGESATVATYHHQGVDRLAEPLVATGWAVDGVIEAVELPGQAWTVGVQWHPEAFGGAPLFESFVAACASLTGAAAR
ncbi:gamma-glutamyl-gamma-aminobutyrate hydrolase family protein [Jatrophihabitans sp.]|uniref:gamma-glutamyl-gamma-aminobutyrate hydrolase family protein n=1 Tax=Jatrophihabitans sp. TaxID=1932789 RepID=UPI0030C7653B